MAREDEFEFVRGFNAALEEQEFQYRMIYLPPKEAMPYEDLDLVTKIYNAVNQMLEDWMEGANVSPLGNLVINSKWAKTINMALAVYKYALLAYYGERPRKEIQAAGKEDSL